MRRKLAFRNAARSMRDYAVYFLTLVLGICIFYMFNSIYDQQVMIGMTAEKTQSVMAIVNMLKYVSVFVAVVLGFLIVYANGFFVKRRKKEMGIYMTLGMHKREISHILILETSGVAFIALVVGIGAGVVLSQFMSVFTARIFEADMTQYHFVFSPQACIKSTLYFMVIFLIVVVCNEVQVSRCKLIDLLYAGRKNEQRKVRNPKILSGIFVIAVVILAVAYYLILDNGLMEIGRQFFASIVLGCMGTLLFFYSVSGLLLTFFQGNKGIYLKNLNMFVVRQLSAKMNSNFVSISVVCLVLFLTIGVFTGGYGMKDALGKMVDSVAEYSATVYRRNVEENAFQPIREDLLKNMKLVGDCAYIQYEAETKYSAMSDTEIADKKGFTEYEIQIIKESNFRELMQMCQKEVETIQDGKYLLVSNLEAMLRFAREAKEQNRSIPIGKYELQPQEVLEANIENGNSVLTVIVKDEVAADLKPIRSIWNIKGEEVDYEGLRDSLERAEERLCFDDGYMMRDKQEMIEKASAQKALMIFLALYLGLVFMICSATVLAIQQLTDTEDSRVRYQMLSQIGVEEAMQKRALFTQILCYFVFPVALATVHSIVGVKLLVTELEYYGHMDIRGTLFTTITFVVILYAAYFIITYLQSKKLIFGRK